MYSSVNLHPNRDFGILAALLGRQQEPTTPDGFYRESPKPSKLSVWGRIFEQNGISLRAGLSRVGTFSRTKKSRVRKSTRVKSSPQWTSQQRKGGFPRKGLIPGNGLVVDPANPHTPRSIIRQTENFPYKLVELSRVRRDVLKSLRFQEHFDSRRRTKPDGNAVCALCATAAHRNPPLGET